MALFKHLPVFLELPGPPPIRGLIGRNCSGPPRGGRRQRLEGPASRIGTRQPAKTGRTEKIFAAAEQEEARTTPSNAASTTLRSSAASTPASETDSSAPAVSKFDTLVEQLDRLSAASINPG
ncbi:hypothetical protein HPB52_025560 [Rhipicephalus sanguineus]|uniref:Uncharacterized protein n=1 Tax=Rhipicephalus sanguineus TaxID=34632 RepID=A0A9D4YRD9_RHISA|nr:hypothetical protein HPB52_025560 [Rhipicephalus sanguineus]